MKQVMFEHKGEYDVIYPGPSPWNTSLFIYLFIMLNDNYLIEVTGQGPIFQLYIVSFFK